MTIEESLISVCADTPGKLRVCDASRLFEMALEERCMLGVKKLLKRHNVPAFKAFEEAESEHFTSIYQPELT